MSLPIRFLPYSKAKLAAARDPRDKSDGDSYQKYDSNAPGLKSRRQLANTRIPLK